MINVFRLIVRVANIKVFVFVFVFVFFSQRISTAEEPSYRLTDVVTKSMQ
jgi:hypothetical protein